MPELTRSRRRLILAICSMSLLIVGMDNTIVNVALPSIGRAFDASVSGLQWTIDSYTLVLASLLILSGSIGDRLGRKRIFITGLVIFTLGSAMCSVSGSLEMLVAFRILQAVGGSMLNPVAMSIITNVFTDPRERAQAIGVWGGVVGISLGLGPIIGGLMIAWFDWRGIFWVNVPIGVAAVLLTWRFVPESRAEVVRRPDLVGQALAIVTLASLTYAIIEVPRRGWNSTGVVVAAVTALVAGVVFVGYERRRFQPLLDLRFFRSIPFSTATLLALFAFGAFAGFLLLNTFYLQDVRGYSALLTGVSTLPLAVTAAVFAPISGRLVGTRGTRLPLLVAGIGMTAGAVMLVRVGPGTAVWWLLAAYTVFGFGFGMVNAPITNSAVSGLPKEQAGVAAGMASTSRQVGSTLGIAVIGSVLAAGLHGPISAGFTAASPPAWWLITVCGAVVLVVGLFASGARARASEAGVRERLMTGTRMRA